MPAPALPAVEAGAGAPVPAAPRPEKAAAPGLSPVRASAVEAGAPTRPAFLCPACGAPFPAQRPDKAKGLGCGLCGREACASAKEVDTIDKLTKTLPTAPAAGEANTAAPEKARPFSEFRFTSKPSPAPCPPWGAWNFTPGFGTNLT
jgi:hypothetical protein